MSSRIPCISFRQPIPEMILRGIKTMETRSRNANLKGTYYIHVSKGKTWAREDLDFSLEDLPKGVVVGKVDIVETKIYRNANEWFADSKKHGISSLPPQFPFYGFVLKNPVRVKPFACKGQLGLPFWVEKTTKNK